MTWRIGVEHMTRFGYAGQVRSSYNEARITPLTTVDQVVLEATVQVTPPTRMYRYLDYWGSVVHAFDIDEPHDEMTVVGRSVIETERPAPDEAAGGVAGPTWDELARPDVIDDWAELLAPTTIVAPDAELEAVAAELKASTTPATAGAAVSEWVRSHLTYVPGATGVQTSAVEAWRGGQGVCQDFAHLTLAMARSMGLPARYCSGYLHPDATAALGEPVAGESHAWVELWAGAWRGYDPTTGEPVGDRHVLVTRGRDYHDVTPLKGVFNGGPARSLDVTVALTRLA